MKILFALDKYRTSDGGADRLARAAVTALANAGHYLRVMEAGTAAPETGAGFSIISHPLPHPRWVRDTDITTLRWNGLWQTLVAEEIRAFSPDLVLTQNMLAPGSVLAARKSGVPTVILLHGYRCLSPDFFAGRDALTAPAASFWNVPPRSKIKWPYTAATLRLYRQAYTTATRVIANSHYTANVVERFFARAADVLYPIVDLAHTEPSPLQAETAGAILFVKPQPIKGAARFLQIAASLPARQFIVAGKANHQIAHALAQLPNVDYRGWVDDMPALYRAAALLLGPAQLPEPFGRVYVEAALSGVPAVSTDAGGIPEAIGEGGTLIDMHAPPDAWRRAIEDILSTPDRYANYAAAARNHAQNICRTHNAARLLDLITA